MGSLEHLSPLERRAVTLFVERVRGALGELVLDARLFGSRARGEGHEESDLDIAIIVDDGGRARRHEVYDLADDIAEQFRIVLSPRVVEIGTLEDSRRRELLFSQDLDRDGVSL